jgi:hypothetical protein
MANVLLGVTGSVAAIRTPELVAALAEAGHAVRVVATEAACYFFDSAAVPNLYRDADEWPGSRYQRGDPILHIELRRWAALLLIAPLDANTLAKLAMGLCDNCLTCVWRAWNVARPVVLAPAMNTHMWHHPAHRPAPGQRARVGRGRRPTASAGRAGREDPGLRRQRHRRDGPGWRDCRGGQLSASGGFRPNSRLMPLRMSASRTSSRISSGKLSRPRAMALSSR